MSDAQEQIAGLPAAEIADPRELPIQADRAHGGRAADLIVGDVVDLERSGIDVAQNHVGIAHAVEVPESQLIEDETDASCLGADRETHPRGAG